MRNTFLILGITGMAITLVINIFLFIFTDARADFIFAFYIVWIVFLVIGIAQVISKKRKNIS